MVVFTVIRGAAAVLAVEGHEDDAEHVKSRQEYSNHGKPEEHGLCLEGANQDSILAPESGQRPDACQTQTADEESGVSPGHRLAQSAHQSHIEGPGGVTDAARPHKEQGLEEGVREQVEHADGYRAFGHCQYQFRSEKRVEMRVVNILRYHHTGGA